MWGERAQTDICLNAGVGICKQSGLFWGCLIARAVDSRKSVPRRQLIRTSVEISREVTTP